MIAVEVVGLNPDNGSHFDVLIGLPLVLLVAIGYVWYRRRQKRKRMALYAVRRYEFKEFVRDVTPAWRQEWGHEAPGDVYDQGPYGSSVGYATLHEFLLTNADPDREPLSEAEHAAALYNEAATVELPDPEADEGRYVRKTLGSLQDHGWPQEDD